MKNQLSALLLFCLFVLTGIFNNTTAQTYSWSQINDYGGTIRFGVYSFTIGNFAYVGGGYANGTSVSDVWRLNPANDSWTQMSNCPLAVRATGNFTLNGLGYVVCGLIGGSTIVDDVFEYDPLTNIWSSKADFPGTKIYGGSSFAINGKGYFGVGNSGGSNGPYLNAFYEYDPIADSWTLKTPFPGISRYGTFGLAINSMGYIGFGANEAQGILFNDWYEYDPINNSWAQKTNFPGGGRAYTTGFTINNFGFVATGNIGTTTMENDVYKYDPLANSWAMLPDFGGVGRWAARGFAIGDTGYLGTGLDGTNYLNDFWKFTPDSLTSVNDIVLNNISIYPNPSVNILTLQSSQLNTLQSIDIFNMEGKVVKSLTGDGNATSLQIDISAFKPGTYFMKINFSDKSLTRKILKL